MVYAEDDEFPKLRHEGSRLCGRAADAVAGGRGDGYPKKEIDRFAKMATDWAKKQDVFVFFISGAKERNPAAAMALQEKLGLINRRASRLQRVAAQKVAGEEGCQQSKKAPAKKK